MKRGGGNGNGDKPPPSSSSSSSQASSPSSTNTIVTQTHHRTSKETSKSPFLKLDVKFEKHMYNGEVNVEKLDNWIHQLEVYFRIQNLQEGHKDSVSFLENGGCNTIMVGIKDLRGD